jgi:hypothetical protein
MIDAQSAQQFFAKNSNQIASIVGEARSKQFGLRGRLRGN